MKRISSFALAVALVVGGAIVTAPIHQVAAAPKKKKSAVPPADAPRQLNISKASRPMLAALEKAVKANDAAAYALALPAAEAAATNPDEKYFVAVQRYQRARATNDGPGQVAALETLIGSGGAQPPELAAAHATLGTAAYTASDWQRAHDNFLKVTQLRPDDTDARFNLALTKIKLKKGAEALPLLQQSIAASKAAGTAVPEAWYRTALQLAYETRQPTAVAMSREVYAAYPTAENWRNALVVYRDSVRTDSAANIDTLRLMRASKAIALKNEYYDLAIELSDAGLPGEAKLVLEESVAAKLGRPTDDTYRRVMALVAAKVSEDRAALSGLEARAGSAPTGRLAFRTADALLGYGEHARAAALYRIAISKGGADVDTGLANTRLGIALALAGNKAEAETAFRATTGPRSALAAYWLDWLAKRP